MGLGDAHQIKQKIAEPGIDGIGERSRDETISRSKLLFEAIRHAVARGLIQELTLGGFDGKIRDEEIFEVFPVCGSIVENGNRNRLGRLRELSIAQGLKILVVAAEKAGTT